MKVVKCSVNSLTENPENARAHTPDDIASIERSLEKFGQKYLPEGYYNPLRQRQAN